MNQNHTPSNKLRYDYNIMLFDDLEIETLVKDDELYVRVSALAQHLSKAVHEFANESQALSHIVGLTEKEKAFIMGVVEGMYNVVVMLIQSYDEHELKQINTIEELLEKFDESSK